MEHVCLVDILVCLFLGDFDVLSHIHHGKPYISASLCMCHCFFQACKGLTTSSLLSKGPSQGIKCYIPVECFHNNTLFNPTMYEISIDLASFHSHMLHSLPIPTDTCWVGSTALFFANSISSARLSCDLTLIVILIIRKKARGGIQMGTHDGLQARGFYFVYKQYGSSPFIKKRKKCATSAGPVGCFKCIDLDIPIHNFSLILHPKQGHDLGVADSMGLGILF